MRTRARRLLSSSLLLVLLLSLCGCAVCRPSASPSADENNGCSLTVYFFSAGKADAILLTTENASVLIDCGEKGFGQTIQEYLEAHGVTQLDVLIVTHFDRDHIGGAAKLINNIPIGEVLQSNCPKESEEYEKYVKALKRAKLEPITVREDYTFEIDGVKFTVNPPTLEDYETEDSNNSSLIVTVSAGTHTLLFTGDAQTERLKEYLSDSPAECELIKIPHHGSKEKKLPDLLAATSPTYAVITCDAEDPDISTTLNALDRAGVQTYLTSEAPVKVVCSGENISVDYDP